MAVRGVLGRQRSLYKGIFATRTLWGRQTRRNARWISSALKGEAAVEICPPAELRLRLACLVQAYREHGHKAACVDPLGLQPRPPVTELALERFGLSAHAKIEVDTEGLLHGGAGKATTSVGELVEHLDSAYCGGITIETAQIPDVAEREWVARRFEEATAQQFTQERKRETLVKLAQAQAFDRFLAKRYQHVKRYGGEGAETMITFIDETLRHCPLGGPGVSTVVIGMPHRGRLNLLTGPLQYPIEALLHKLNSKSEHAEGLPSTGDVASHLSTSVDLEVPGREGKVHVTLLPNPSHLEGICPVAMGNVRGRRLDPDEVLCLQIHGDAAFAGQGIVAESLALSNLPGFTVGGSLHLIVNNQLGFTTGATHGRSSAYSSDLGKIIGCPVIRVNGADPENVMRACQIAIDYRTKFKKDVIVDLICFRRWGHNELDDPSMTQPIMYEAIEKRTSIPDEYAIAIGEEELANSTHQKYTDNLNMILKAKVDYKPMWGHLTSKWGSMAWPSQQDLTSFDTGLPPDLLRYVGGRSGETGSVTHPTVVRVFEERRRRLGAGSKLDWATGESLAVGSLLMQGFSVRLCGQDVGRGTFSHRHFTITDQTTAEEDVPLSRLGEGQGQLEVVNSPLSEEAVLGFEYGVSLSDPQWLVMWEAQFGDFFNGAQIIVDTFVSTGEAKWLLQCGLVMLLPHGYDGAGPEHSSSRLERFLQMTDSQVDRSDGDAVNMHVVHPTTPAQYFHLIRRQMLRNFRKPLIVASPKILLRYPEAVSSLSEMAPGTTFQYVLPDPLAERDPSKVTQVVLCSGKHYYTLDKYRKEQGRTDVAIVRVECLCPFPTAYIHQAIAHYTNAKEFVWSQEEHQNMGPWSFVEPRVREQLGIQMRYAGRGVSAPPAVGVAEVHRREAQELLHNTFPA